MTTRELASIKRRRPPQKDRCIPVAYSTRPEDIHNLPEKLAAIARLLRSLAADCDYTAQNYDAFYLNARHR